MGVLTGCQPRPEVLSGDLQDTIFAADFGDLISDAEGTPLVYKDAHRFFENTHPAAELKKVVQAVFGQLANAGEPGATIRLSTGFGGGKTHTLMALYHLAKNIANPAMGTELLPAAGRPQSVRCVAVDAGKAGIPQFATHGSIEVHSLWGEVFFRLGGEAAMRSLGASDHPDASPSEAQLISVLPPGPVLFLLDELVIYMAKLSSRGQGNLLGFLNLLASVAAKRPRTVLVVTDPRGQAAYAREVERMQKVVAAANKLDEVIGRRGTDFDPIGKEAAQVICRRLLEKKDEAQAQVASAAYHSLYQRVAAELPGRIPPAAATVDYARRIVECYPFHPRLLDTAQDRLDPLPDFQKSRGVLRLFARMLREVWDRKEDLTLISAGDIDWSSPRIQGDLLHRLDKDKFRAAVNADVEKHAGELDGGAPRGIHRRVASALLLESLPLDSRSGMDHSDVTLAILRPEEAGPEPGDALDRLVGVCWHLHPREGGSGWRFRYEPSVIKQVEERKTKFQPDDAQSRVHSEIQDYFGGGSLFTLVSWPETASTVKEKRSLQLVLCEEEEKAKLIVGASDDSDPASPLPRSLRNSIVAVAASSTGLADAQDRALSLLAVDDLIKELGTGEENRLAHDQLVKVRPTYLKQFRLQARRAFDRVLLTVDTRSRKTGDTKREVMSYPIEEQFQVSEEEILQHGSGQKRLKKFLEDKGLMYKDGQTMDVDLFLKSVLPGAVPLPDQPGVYTASAVYDRFLAAPNVRLVPDAGILRQTLINGVSEGKLVIRLADGRAYDADGVVDGPEGNRRRSAGTLHTLPVDDDKVLVALANSPSAALWLKVDNAAGSGAAPIITSLPPEPSATARAGNWQQAMDYAQQRPLIHLKLKSKTPAAAATLAGLAQPLGADKLSLTVYASGDLKDGGNVTFSANDVRISSPTRPLSVAQALFNALVEGAIYEAELNLDFGEEGRTGMADQIEALAEKAGQDVAPDATFAKPDEDGS